MTHHTRWRGIARTTGYSASWIRAVAKLGRRWCSTGTPNEWRSGFIFDAIEIIRADKLIERRDA